MLFKYINDEFQIYSLIFLNNKLYLKFINLKYIDVNTIGCSIVMLVSEDRAPIP